MKINIDVNKIVTTILIGIATYILTTVYTLDKEVSLINYKLDQTNYVLQDIYETLGENNGNSKNGTK